MASRTPRRAQGLSRGLIVDTAVALLDAAGEPGLTFRALADRLATGPGALYWHVANKDELLAAATESVVATALSPGPGAPVRTPAEEIHAVALALFDAVDDHPWLATRLGTQFARGPAGPAPTVILERVGRPVRALGAPEATWFTTASTLVNYVLGAAGQNAANGRAGSERDGSRSGFLDTVATTWEGLDPTEFAFVRAVAGQLREHDDREQFLAGIDLILAGIAAVHPSGGRT
ncbi:TetR/AcrR family transcriptional regulator [Pseudonocardia sp. HH130630-07]|uniref:TetR/AcrR family transcriptional regulator n=1 Tax=Pseudonocardia sp. HH130630-07 TaxID=1690815 RepID=UPI0018D27B3A|nr:TetR/AcrR family transcriptional regulator [Pseudonocardia sp. HH130630-07]